MFAKWPYFLADEQGLDENSYGSGRHRSILGQSNSRVRRPGHVIWRDCGRLRELVRDPAVPDGPLEAIGDEPLSWHDPSGP